MKKGFLLVISACLLVLPLISAISLNIQSLSNDTALILGSGMPAIFDLNITNFGTPDYFMFYNFWGADTFPKGTTLINGLESKVIQVGVYPRSDLRQLGRVQFDLYIQGQGKDQMTYPLMVDVVELKDAFGVGAEEFDPSSNNVTVYLENLINFNFENIGVKLSSPFFNLEKTISLAPYQKQTFEVTLNKDDFKSLVAGFYTLKAEITANPQKADIEGVMKFSEKNIVTNTQDDYGVIVSTKRITKINEGNVVSDTTTVVEKNIISRLFTTFSPDPDMVERQGLIVYYTWEKQLKPGEILNITIKTNWLLPLLAILLIVAIIILVKQFSKTSLSLKKKVTFVKAKGGEFALKVSVVATARKYIEKVNVIDRLPMLVRLHEKFGGEMPKRVDEKARRIEWYFEKLQPGESRIISYIIYSKVGVLGKFALPTTTAIYERDGEVHEAESNHAFFIADQARRPIDE